MEMLEMEIGLASNNKLYVDDPLLKYGSGITGFREITKHSAYLYFVLVLFSLPMIIINYNGTSIL